MRVHAYAKGWYSPTPVLCGRSGAERMQARVAATPQLAVVLGMCCLHRTSSQLPPQPDRAHLGPGRSPSFDAGGQRGEGQAAHCSSAPPPPHPRSPQTPSSGGHRSERTLLLVGRGGGWGLGIWNLNRGTSRTTSSNHMTHRYGHAALHGLHQTQESSLSTHGHISLLRNKRMHGRIG